MNKTVLFLCSFLLLSISSKAASEEVATFAGGCFWCMESDFEKLDGVREVISGFTGGQIKNPTYNGDHRGHYEAVEVYYDPEVVSYQQLLEHYWVNIDPFDDRGQFCDKGHEYLSAIFVSDPEKKALAEQSREKVVARFKGNEIVTPILPLSTFYPIKGNESYHQDFYKTNAIKYKYYRWNCGRDARLAQIWGDPKSFD